MDEEIFIFSHGAFGLNIGRDQCMIVRMQPRLLTWLLPSFLVVVSLIAIVASWFEFKKPATEQLVDLPTEQLIEEPIFPHILPPRSSLYSTLRELSVTSQTIHAIVEAAKPVMDLGRLNAGTRFRLIHLTDPSSELTGIEFQLSTVEKLAIEKVDDVWKAEKRIATVETKVVTFKGLVTSTLWESAEAAQMNPDLIVQLAEIFAWEVDFAREVRVNDRWRLTVEQKLVHGQVAGWGAILAAEYENAGELHTAVLYQSGEKSGYYSADGQSLRRMFLKSPIKFGRISSRFNRKRFHPIHKVHRPHLGVDYAAPTGTPIRAVGDGVVIMAKYNGGGGNTVRIRHNASYQTYYLHLSRFEKGVRAGTRVRQGQTIGYVGSTGLSTGPHLHFEFHHNGRVLDPLKQAFPSADPVPKAELAQFQGHASAHLKALPAWGELEIAARDPSSVKGKLIRALAPKEAHAETPKD